MTTEYRQSRKGIEILRSWLSSPDLNVFATVTLRQSRTSDGGDRRWITVEDVSRTAWLLRDRLTKKLLPAGALRKGCGVNFLPFREGNGTEKRFHLHIVTSMPTNMSWEEYRATFFHVSSRLDWVYDEIDLRQIGGHGHDEPYRVVGYSLKEGTDAFIPEAAFVTPR
jgi:hypothetical protein